MYVRLYVCVYVCMYISMYVWSRNTKIKRAVIGQAREWERKKIEKGPKIECRYYPEETKIGIIKNFESSIEWGWPLQKIILPKERDCFYLKLYKNRLPLTM